MSGQKKFYQRWINITEKSKLINECKLLGNVFERMNFVIKSVTDNVLENSHSNQVKIDAFNKIFLQMNLSLNDSLKRWREINRIEKLKDRMNEKQREMCIKVLTNLLNNGNKNKIRQIINKFRQNRKITDIQRNFLKRLLMSKAGLVVIGFRKWQSLP